MQKRKRTKTTGRNLVNTETTQTEKRQSMIILIITMRNRSHFGFKYLVISEFLLKICDMFYGFEVNLDFGL